MSDQKQLAQKYKKHLPTGFEEIAESMAEKELKDTIYNCQANIWVIEKSKEEDSKLQQAKEEVKTLSEPYTDGKRVQEAKAKMCLFVLEQRGIDLDK